MSDETEEFRDKTLAELEECQTKLLRIVTEYSRAFTPTLAVA